MSRITKYAVAVAIAGVPAAIGLRITRPTGVQPPAWGDVAGPFFERLATARGERKAQIVAYFQAARRSAEGVLEDPVMMDAFAALRGRSDPPDPLRDLQLDLHFVNCYGEFFDVLFVDGNGYVFHSMRRESDYHSNLFTGPMAAYAICRLPKSLSPCLASRTMFWG